MKPTKPPRRHPTPAQIKKAREDAGLTPRQAAELIGYTRQAWANWERAGRKMRMSLYLGFKKLVKERSAK